MITLFLLGYLQATSQSQIAGFWDGYWTRAGDTMAISLEIKLDRTTNKYSATFDSERLRVAGIPFADVHVSGCCNVTMTLRGDRTTAVFTGTLRQDAFAGTFTETNSGNGSFAFTRARENPSGFEEKEVTFQNGAVTLAGSVILPRSGNSLPAVVFLHGSGAEGRWASRFLATQLAKQGIASLIYDKRGVGKSTGDWRTASLNDLTGDARAALTFVAREPRIDPRRIGIHGHSQGGTLAPMVAAQSSNVAFVVGSAAAGTPTDSTEIYSILNSLRDELKTAKDSTDARAYVNELVGVAYKGGSRDRLETMVTDFRARPWFFAPPAPDNSYWTFSREFGRYDPLSWWRRVRVPVLLLYGEKDERVPAAESARRISESVRSNPGADVTVRIFPGADHTFRLPPGAGGWPVTAPDYLTTLTSWLQARR